MRLNFYISSVLLFSSVQVYAQQYDFEKLASDLFSGNQKPAKVAITTDLKSAGIATSNAKAIEEAITTAVQRKATSQNHSVIAASELAKIYDYKQFTGDRSDFAELAEKLKADLLILVTVQKLNSKTAQVSGKLLGVGGDNQGKVLGASKVYEIPIAAVYRVFVEGVFENNERKDKLDDNVLIGLTNQAVFSGEIVPGKRYLIVDDFIGQGGTIVNLRGHILQQGGVVVGATVLTGKDYSAILELESNKLSELRRQHGQIEDWWRQRFGFGFDCLTASEARYLSNTATSETIRARIEAAYVDA